MIFANRILPFIVYDNVLQKVLDYHLEGIHPRLKKNSLMLAILRFSSRLNKQANEHVFILNTVTGIHFEPEKLVVGLRR